MKQTSGDKVWAIVAYASYFFLPIIVPLFIWLLGPNEYVKQHGRSAFLISLVPSIINIVFIGVLAIYGLGVADDQGLAVLAIFGVAAILILNLVLFIWIIVRIVKVATNRI
ncbi:DUF4870 domain-containing protein [Listeria costaricensis]|uniref:DUF4870 domain-containing protein n=1 Tax=Listeria costaricensis TaxID=2026604 RepID=UPI000C07196D|nr:DUF4870 domain-containing protein [Listeria costaricensis]